MITLTTILSLLFFYSFLKILKQSDWSIKRLFNDKPYKESFEAYIFVTGVITISLSVVLILVALIINYLP